MSWKVRHEGSPRAVENVSLDEIVEGMQNGVWELTDEVQGPGDKAWVAIENHPQLAETAAELEPPPTRSHDDETRLDMNALIDVCLVLLIFFILTTSYAALQKMLDMPSLTGEGKKGPIRISEKEAEQVMIVMDVKMENGEAVMRINNEVVGKYVPKRADMKEREDAQRRQDNEATVAQLIHLLSRFVGQDRKRELLLKAEPDVPHGAVVAIQDAAKGAGITKVHRFVPPEEVLPARRGGKQ